MNIKTFALLNLVAACAPSTLFAGCAAAPPSGDSGSSYLTPDPYQKQINRQEAISRQQRSLMR